MQSVCPQCNTLNPIGNQFCGNCGASLESAKVVQEVQPVRVETRPKRSNLALWLVVLIVIACVVLWAISRSGGSSSRRETTSHDAIGAWVVTQQFVEDNLVSPATADFPCCYDDYTEHLGNGLYRIESYVDSQNRMGALVRTYFTAEVQWVSGDTYRLESLVFDE